MRIKSDFKDYYDIGLRHDEDGELLFLRRTKDVQLKPEAWRSNALDGGPDELVIGFCGKLYPLLSYWEPMSGETHCYSIEEVDAFARGRMNKREFGIYLGEDKREDYQLSTLRQKRRDHLSLVLPNGSAQYDWLKEFFGLYNTPIFLYRKYWLLTINPRLSDFNFARIVDPWTAFQEVRMWMGNQVEPRKIIPVLDDETMRDIKGFDKWSFRKPPKDK